MSPNLAQNDTKPPTPPEEEAWVYLENFKPRAVVMGRVAAVARLIKNAKLTDLEKRKIKMLLEQEIVFHGTELKIVGWWEDLYDAKGDKHGQRLNHDRSIILVAKE